MGRGVIDLPMKEVTVFFEDICNREQWDQNLMVGGCVGVWMDGWVCVCVCVWVCGCVGGWMGATSKPLSC